MPNLDSEGYEFFGLKDAEIRGMLIERIEFLMANLSWSKKTLADKAGLPTSSVYTKLDRESTGQLTFLDMCAIAKAMDISVIQLLPLTAAERLAGGKPPAKASMLKMWDVLLSRSAEELEVIYQIDKLLHAKKS
ncbi:XRE family transcriptional regulator [Agarivorans sp. 1_MG-2023]|uniref:XRE family transcriptional regulator n=1 Tax=Agarivorans sp. 1_MG-2023 TaxID=3062634 RepID=UPI0026E3EB73|nr:XRE family transcriptional regulator [Agarivorans sp. 1_MG-2023]MDO6764686.1 XRE family transcriptional regulator [Agarivorans sp. 1_MG-2023]